MIDPAVVELLQPFIVTSWYGHRNDLEIPEAVREVWRDKFRGGRANFGRKRPPPPRRKGPPEAGRKGPPRPGKRGPPRQGRGGPPQQSNVDLAVLDPDGKVVHSFDGFRRNQIAGPRRGERRETLGDYTARELKKAISRLTDLPELPAADLPESLNLPDLESSRGIRVFVSLMDDRMTAYRAPVVEVVRLDDDDWRSLAYPEKERTVDASVLEKWLSQVYPPGVMERTNPRTKMVYKIAKAEGKLSLAASGASKDLRFAVLRGTVRLIDEGPNDFGYTGTLEVVLAYRPSESMVHSLRGVFDGIYPRVDRRQQRQRQIPLRAAFESIPE